MAATHRLRFPSLPVWGLLALPLALALAPVSPQNPAWKAPSRAARKKNPLPNDAATIAKGKAVFTAQCVSCHGESGIGNGPAAKDLEKHPGDLTDPRVQAQSDGSLFWKITAGRAPMTAFSSVLSVEERWQVVRYVRTLAGGASLPISQPELEAPPVARAALGRLFDAYDAYRAALAGNDAKCASGALPALREAAAALASLDPAALGRDRVEPWKQSMAAVSGAVDGLARAEGLAAMRAAFTTLSGAAEGAWTRFGHDKKEPLYVLAGSGERWVQATRKPADPRGSALPDGSEPAKPVKGLSGTKNHEEPKK